MITQISRTKHGIATWHAPGCYLLPTKEEVHVFARVCLSVCLTVSKITQKRVDGFGWNVACRQMSEHGRTDYLLSPIRPDPDHRPDAGTGLLSPISYKRCYAEFYVWKIPCIHIDGLPLQRGVVLQWFYSLSHRNTFVRGTCALPSALLVKLVSRDWLFVHLLHLTVLVVIVLCSEPYTKLLLFFSALLCSDWSESFVNVNTPSHSGSLASKLC